MKQSVLMTTLTCILMVYFCLFLVLSAALYPNIVKVLSPETKYKQMPSGKILILSCTVGENIIATTKIRNNYGAIKSSIFPTFR